MAIDLAALKSELETNPAGMHEGSSRGDTLIRYAKDLAELFDNNPHLFDRMLMGSLDGKMYMDRLRWIESCGKELSKEEKANGN